MMDMIDYDKDIKGAFGSLNKDKQQIVMEIVANFHYQNGSNHFEGFVEITLEELNDCLAQCLINPFR